LHLLSKSKVQGFEEEGEEEEEEEELPSSMLFLPLSLYKMIIMIILARLLY